MVGSIVVAGVLTHCALLYFMCDLKAVQINMQHSLIQELMLYKIELGYSDVEGIKNICCAKKEVAADCSTVTRGEKKFC